LALWMLGYPQAALADANQALSKAREIGDAATDCAKAGSAVGPVIIYFRRDFRSRG
jgi:hypothetical protein